MVVRIEDVFASMSNASTAVSELLRRNVALPATVRMGGLGRLVASNSLSNVEYLAVAEVIEDALANGDQQTKDAVATGLLETMVNAGGSASSLGPLARQYCSELAAFFGEQ